MFTSFSTLRISNHIGRSPYRSATLSNATQQLATIGFWQRGASIKFLVNPLSSVPPTPYILFSLSIWVVLAIFSTISYTYSCKMRNCLPSYIPTRCGWRDTRKEQSIYTRMRRTCRNSLGVPRPLLRVKEPRWPPLVSCYATRRGGRQTGVRKVKRRLWCSGEVSGERCAQVWRKREHRV